MAFDIPIPRSGVLRILLPSAFRSALLWAVLLVISLPGTTRAAIPVALYPVQGPATQKSRDDVRGLVAVGLQMAERRHLFTARNPLVAPPQCASPATTQCLAALAGNGVIIYAVARDEASAVEVTLLLVTGEGKRTDEIRFENGRFLQDDRLAARVIEALEGSYLQLGAPPVTVATPSPVQKPQVDLAPQKEPAAPTVAASADEAPPSRPKWLKPAAIGCGIGGAVVFGAGAVFGAMAKSLNNELTARYDTQSLVPADGAKYSRLKTYNHLANAMMIGGGVLAAAGVTFWALSPSVGVSSDGDTFSLGGSF